MKKAYIFVLLTSLACAISAMKKKADYSVYTGEGKKGSYIGLTETVHSENETTIFELIKFKNGTEIGVEETGYMMQPLRTRDENRLRRLMSDDSDVKEAIKKAQSSGKCIAVKKGSNAKK